MAKLYSRQWWPSIMLGLDFGLVSPINWVNHFGKMSYSLLVCFSLCKLRNDGNKEKEVEVCHLHLVCTHIVLNSELFFFLSFNESRCFGVCHWGNGQPGSPAVFCLKLSFTPFSYLMGTWNILIGNTCMRWSWSLFLVSVVYNSLILSHVGLRKTKSWTRYSRQMFIWMLYSRVLITGPTSHGQ